MDKYQPGHLIPLLQGEEKEQDLVFCEIIAYRGKGCYYVSLTRLDMVENLPNKFCTLSVIHESIIRELEIHV